MSDYIRITLCTFALSATFALNPDGAFAASHQTTCSIIPPSSVGIVDPAMSLSIPSDFFRYTGPIYFIENKGQVTDQYGNSRSDVDFRVPAGDGLNIFIGPGKIHYQWSRPAASALTRDAKHFSEQGPMPSTADRNSLMLSMYRLDMRLVGANVSSELVVEDIQPYHEQYYFPHCCPDGVKAHAFRRIIYREVYPAIDWVLYIRHNKLEYDFVVHPGGNVSDIQMQYEGASKLALTSDGGLIVTTPEGSITEQKPFSFVAAGKEINSRFVLQQNIVKFNVGSYDPNEILTIDPVIQWATYYGGSDGDYRGTVACDANGNVYLAGDAASRNNIATVGSHQSSSAGNLDGFLVKFNASGVRQWATFFGGMDHDYCWNLTCDRQNNIYVVGQTYSNAGIATAGSHQMAFGGGTSDAYLIKFDDAGVRQWGTYYGGGITLGGTGVDYGFAVACDQADNVYIAGHTTSEMGIATPGAHQGGLAGKVDGFVAKFNSSGVRQWGSYYGGADEDQIQSITCDFTGNVYVAGYTQSTNGIASPGSHQATHGGRYDAFLAKFSGTGARQWGTYYGGGEIDRGYSVHWNESGALYLAGDTYSPSAIATVAAHQPTYGGNNRQDAFLARFNEQGVRQWATYYGGTMDDEARAVTTNPTGAVFVAGFTSSTSGIATAHGPQTVNGGGQDAFLAKFTPAGTRDWSTYYGGTGIDYGYSVAVDGDRIYLSGQTSSAIGIATSGSHQDGYGGGAYDDYLVRLNDCQPPTATLSYDGDSIFCAGDSLLLRANVGPGLSWQWQLNGLDIAGAVDSVYHADTTGIYTVTVFNGSCGTISNSVKIEVLPRPETPAARNNGPLCNGQTLHLAAPSTDAVAWNWIGPAMFTTTARSPSVADIQMQHAGIYKVTTVHANGCVSDTGYTTVTVIPFSVIFNDTSVCAGTPALLYGQVHAPDSFAGFRYEWIPAEGLSDAYTQFPVIDREPGTYAYRFTAISTTPIQCTASDSGTVTVLPSVQLSNVTEDQIIHYGASVRLHAEGADYYEWSPSEYLSHPLVQSPLATPEESIRYIVEGFRSDGCSSTDTVFIEVNKTVHDFVPTAFTPNGDGKNDVFRVANLTTQKLLEFRVFNRYGEEVFATADKTQGWDGTWKGVPQPTGTYSYLIRMTYPDRTYKVITYTGDVMLLR